MLKPKFPAALSCRTHALGRIFDVLGALLGQKTPEFLCAAGFSSSPHLMFSGTDKKGEWFQLFQIGFGGIPGRPFGDGADGHSLWPGFTNVPNEFLERYFPMRIERYETVPDSGGAGKFRGGNGIHMTYAFLERGEISIHDDRWFIPPWGVNGGAPAMRSWKRLDRADGTQQMLAAKCDKIVVLPGDKLHFVTWGRWRVGQSPGPRPCARGARSRTRAGDSEGRGRLRRGARCERPGRRSRHHGAARPHGAQPRARASVFDRGPDIATLRLECLAETGLQPPVAPVWAVPVAA